LVLKFIRVDIDRKRNDDYDVLQLVHVPVCVRNWIGIHEKFNGIPAVSPDIQCWTKLRHACTTSGGDISMNNQVQVEQGPLTVQRSVLGSMMYCGSTEHLIVCFFNFMTRFVDSDSCWSCVCGEGSY
jgi:hypothetical protein